ncbi:hypothetical protein RISK_000891 [Rhodopirellula islandica]|uniref:Uncharacterized protein n=1 Tax=Rhodopirellula islandica TaxID=595434 RepID=A0A0J1BKM7_RHOIS|nr:hypothetical protein RISK_000891 [Rhodopirellula islandica]
MKQGIPTEPGLCRRCCSRQNPASPLLPFAADRPIASPSRVSLADGRWFRR